MSLIGLDIGGTSMKAVAFSLNGDIIASEHREYSAINEYPGCFELNSRQIWEYAKEIISKITYAYKSEIHAITVSSLGECFVCLDEDDNIISNCIIYHDKRGKDLFKEFVDHFTLDEIHRILGTRANYAQSLHRLRVLKKEKPEVIKKTKKICFLADFILYMLGGEHCCDYTMAMTTSCFNAKKLQWQKEFIEWGGINPEIFPSVVPAGTQIGTISRSIAEELGINSGVRLVIGPHDQTASTIGANTYQPGQLFNAIGTNDAMLTFTNSLAIAKKAFDSGLYYGMHYYKDIYTVNPGPQYSGGAVLKWFRDHFGKLEKHLFEEAKKDFYSGYEERIPKEPTNLMVIGHFAGLLEDKDAKGAILNLTLDTNNETIYRAFMEGETYLARTRVEKIINAGLPISIVRTVGGGSKSDTFMQIRADIFKIPVATINCMEPGAFGDALLGGVASGIYNNIRDIADKLIRITKVFEPNPVNMNIYDEKYKQNQYLMQLI
ncbi:MAG: FGGY-family carbohydrate kinase [Christensenellales bacterium]